MPALRVVLVVAALVGAPIVATPQIGAPSVWPTRDWATATPESQGLDSGVLADMLDFVQVHQLPVHDVLIVRHGRLLMDATFYPYDASRPHDMASATKSITSILIGLALDKGFLESVRERVSALLPNAMPDAADAPRD